VSAPDVAALGRALGFDGNAAQRKIEAYNRACPRGVFDPRTLDGLATIGLSPVKSNYAVPLDTPPYHAYPIISSNTFTFGGLKVNVNAQVVNTDGELMPGLYAAGETVACITASIRARPPCYAARCSGGVPANTPLHRRQ
jgi:tricarballylate dehydrogenase